MRDYINLFYDLARGANLRGEFEYSQAMENAGSMVNNVAHGLPTLEWIPKVRNIMLGNVDSNFDWATEGHKRAWLDAADFLNSEISLLESRSR